MGTMRIGYWNTPNPLGPDAPLPLVIEQEAGGGLEIRLAGPGERPTKRHENLQQGCFADTIFVVIDVSNQYNYIVAKCKDGGGLCTRLLDARQLNLERGNCAACGSVVPPQRAHHFPHPEIPDLHLWLTHCGKCNTALATMLGVPGFLRPSCIAIAHVDYQQAVQTGDVANITLALTSLQLASAGDSLAFDDHVRRQVAICEIADVICSPLRCRFGVVESGSLGQQAASQIGASLGLSGGPQVITLQAPPKDALATGCRWQEIYAELLFGSCRLIIEALFPADTVFSATEFLGQPPEMPVPRKVSRYRVPAVGGLTWYVGDLTDSAKEKIAREESHRYKLQEKIRFGPFCMEFLSYKETGWAKAGEFAKLEERVARWLASRGRAIPSKHKLELQRFYSKDFMARLLLGPLTKT